MDALRSQTPQQLSRANGPRPGAWDGSLEQGDGSQEQEQPERDTYYETPRSADDLDEDEEFAEGCRQQEELLQRHALWACPRNARLLGDILAGLIGLSQRPEIPYEFLALDTDTPFASSCCHGAVYFSRGLLEALAESGVTFFAAHEMAHTELRHYASRWRRLEELRRAIPAAPGSPARQRMEVAAVMAVRHQEEFEADHLAARWLDFASAHGALSQLHSACQRVSPKSLNVPTHPPFERRLSRLANRQAPPDPLEYLWSLVGG